jgi:predicted NAD/FAD-binding protein
MQRFNIKYLKHHHYNKNYMSRKNICIIGGGISGLITAWLLEDAYNVTILEKEDIIGGHALTVNVDFQGKSYGADAGFEFFSNKMQPTLFNLIKILNVEIKAFPLTYTFFSKDGSSAICMPPVKDGEINWPALSFNNIFYLIQFKYTLVKGAEVVKDKNKIITFLDFARDIGLSEHFSENFLFPVMAGSWMVSVDDIKTFAAYDILKWFTSYSPAELFADTLYEVVGGTSIYVNAIVERLRNTKIINNARVSDIIYKDKQYKVTTEKQTLASFDHLILATNAIEAEKLLHNIPHSEGSRNILRNMKYTYTKMALHGDMSYMPKDESLWTMMNIRIDENGVCSSVYKPWTTPEGYPILRTCISYHDNVPLPDNLYSIKEFYHPLVTPDYLRAQDALRLTQGINNLWFVGVHTYDTDSHESALMSGVVLAETLNPSSERLSALMSHKHKSL